MNVATATVKHWLDAEPQSKPPYEEIRAVLRDARRYALVREHDVLMFERQNGVGADHRRLPFPFAHGADLDRELDRLLASDPMVTDADLTVVEALRDDMRDAGDGAADALDALLAERDELRALLRETLQPGAYGIGSTLAQRIARALAPGQAHMPTVDAKAAGRYYLQTCAACGLVKPCPVHDVVRAEPPAEEK